MCHRFTVRQPVKPNRQHFCHIAILRYPKSQTVQPYITNIDYLVTMQRSARQTLCPSIREDVTSTCTSQSNVAADQPSSHPKQKLIKVKQPRKNCALATEKMLLQPCSDEGRIERPDAASASKAPGTFTLLFSFNLLSEICGKLASDLLMWQLIMQSVTAGCRHKVPFSQR